MHTQVIVAVIAVPDGESEVTRIGFAFANEEGSIFAPIQQHSLRLHAGDIGMEPAADRRRSHQQERSRSRTGVDDDDDGSLSPSRFSMIQLKPSNIL